MGIALVQWFLRTMRSSPLPHPHRPVFGHAGHDSATSTNRLSRPATIIASDPPVPDLPERLRCWAKGYGPASAGVELLIAHQRWIHRSDFVAACVDLFEGYDYLDGLAPMACVLWDRVPRYVHRPEVMCTESMGCVLALAAELCGADTGTPLDELLTNLDDDDAALVLDAILRLMDRTRGLTARV
jgi:hypothetical protein